MLEIIGRYRETLRWSKKIAERDSEIERERYEEEWVIGWIWIGFVGQKWSYLIVWRSK